MSVLLAIKSCYRLRYLEDLQRQTFLQGSPLKHLFFRGIGLGEAPADMIQLSVPDDFLSLPFKVQAMCRWALEHDYENVFFADTDTYVRPERLTQVVLYDYSGFFPYEPEPRAYAVGGSGYWLSARAMRAVLRYEFIMDYPCNQTYEPSKRGEDLQVGWAVQADGLRCHKDVRYRLDAPGPMTGNDFITIHDTAVADKAQRIPRAHETWLTSGGK